MALVKAAPEEEGGTMFIALGRAGRAWLVALAGLAAILGLARLTLPWERSPIPGPQLPAGRPAVAPPAGTAGKAVVRVPAEAAGPRVALTFDVLEGDTVVVQVLDLLAGRRVPATFFVTAPWARAHPDLVRQMVAAGHEVALREAPGPQAGALLDGEAAPGQGVAPQRWQEDAAALARLTGRAVRFVRPAWTGLWDPAGGGPVPEGLEVAGGLQPVLWSLDLQDWMNPGVDYVVHRARMARPGDILLLQASDFARQTPRALLRVLDALAEAGLKPSPLGALLAPEAP
ncbi:polysaccharide deacetylase family protein [Thermaerobacter litoralis]